MENSRLIAQRTLLTNNATDDNMEEEEEKSENAADENAADESSITDSMINKAKMPTMTNMPPPPQTRNRRRGLSSISSNQSNLSNDTDISLSTSVFKRNLKKTGTAMPPPPQRTRSRLSSNNSNIADTSDISLSTSLFKKTVKEKGTKMPPPPQTRNRKSSSSISSNQSNSSNDTDISLSTSVFKRNLKKTGTVMPPPPPPQTRNRKGLSSISSNLLNDTDISLSTSAFKRNLKKTGTVMPPPPSPPRSSELDQSELLSKAQGLEGDDDADMIAETGNLPLPAKRKKIVGTQKQKKVTKIPLPKSKRANEEDELPSSALDQSELLSKAPSPKGLEGNDDDMIAAETENLPANQVVGTQKRKKVTKTTIQKSKRANEEEELSSSALDQSELLSQTQFFKGLEGDDDDDMIAETENLPVVATKKRKKEPKTSLQNKYEKFKSNKETTKPGFIRTHLELKNLEMGNKGLKDYTMVLNSFNNKFFTKLASEEECGNEDGIFNYEQFEGALIQQKLIPNVHNSLANKLLSCITQREIERLKIKRFWPTE